MCHGHPRHHPCAHTSINWHYCPSALIDLETGYETPCRNTTFAPTQPISASCPLRNCQFKDKGGSWTCCSCKQGPNTRGWCTMTTSRTQMNPESLAIEEVETTCDHGCCSSCIRSGPSRDSTPDMKFPEVRKSSASRRFGYGSAPKSHRRASAFSLSGGLPDRDGQTSSSGSSSSSSPDEYQHDDIDYPSKKSKTAQSAQSAQSAKPTSKRHKSKKR